MKTFYVLLTFIFSIATCLAQNSSPVVTITSTQSDTANHTVTINFDVVDADNDPLEISAFLSIDSGLTHLVPGVSLSGDVGFPITPGSNKSLVLAYNPDSLAAAAQNRNAWSTVKVVATDRKTPDINDIISQIDSASVYADMQYLAQTRHHISAPSGLELVKDSIESVFMRHGLQTSRLPFVWNNVNSENLRGRKPGLIRESEVIILDGHFDGVANTPGADDNATAIAAVLAGARVMEDYHFAKSINFLGFDKEEQGLIGAARYVMNQIEPYENIEAVINGEMLGYYDTTANSQQVPQGFGIVFPNAVDSINSSGNRGIFLFVIGNTQNSAWLSAVFDSVARQYVPRVRSLVLNAPGTGSMTPDLRRSDHSVFWDAGIPALMITDGADTRNPHYHQPSDTIGTLNFPYLVRNIRAMVASVAALAEPISAGTATTEAFQLAQNLPVSVAEIDLVGQFELYPNPTHGKITLRFPVSVKEAKLYVFDAEGREILRQSFDAQAREEVRLELQNKKKRILPDGIYTVEVVHNDQRYTRKLVLNQGHSH